MKISANSLKKWPENAAFVAFYIDRHYPAGDRKSKRVKYILFVIYLMFNKIYSARQNTLVAQRLPLLSAALLSVRLVVCRGCCVVCVVGVFLFFQRGERKK